MTTPNTDPTQNPDFIALEMGDAPSALTPDDADAFLTGESDSIAVPDHVTSVAEGMAHLATLAATPAEAPSALSTLAGDLAAIAATPVVTGNAAPAGSIRRDGYLTPTGNDGDSIVSDPAIAAANGAAARAASQAHRARVVATITNAPTVEVPTIDRGILPRAQILKDLAEQSPGTLITVARAQRRATHVPLATIANALAGTEFADMAPRVKSNKRQFGEVMRGLNSQEFRTWAITRRDVQNSGQEWPVSLEARWCMGALDGSDQLGTLGEKVLIADLLDNGEIRFTGGSDQLRAKVIEAFALRCGDQILTATDLLTWFRDRVLPEHFHAFDCAGAIYVPGNPARIEAFIALVGPHMSRRITLWDMVSGKKLADSLMQGLIQMLDEIDTDYGTDVEKAREREANKVRKQNPDHTDADVALAMARAVVLSERAGTYLRRLNDAQSYLDGLKKLLGDDTASIKARLAGIRGIIEPLCDDATAMAANLDFTPSVTVEDTAAPTGPSLLELD